MTPATDELISVSEAERCILSRVPPPTVETVPIERASSRVLAEDIVASRAQPPFDRVTMDGVALASADPSVAFTVTAIGAAGAPPPAFAGHGSCIEIMTGAPLPHGCDMVVPVERVTRSGDQITVDRDVERQPGACVHSSASDYNVGHRLLARGERLSAVNMAVLASAGTANVDVAREPRIHILTSGDELVAPGETVLAHQIYRSNDLAIEALLDDHGWRHTSRAHVPDQPEPIRNAVNHALTHDVIVVTGGVSKGRYDYLPAALTACGVDKQFHRVAQRPGKPMWFGVGPANQLVFALPGNPVSALTCLRRYVIPALSVLVGASADVRSREAVLTEPVRFAPGLAWFAAGCLRGRSGSVSVKTVNTSGDLFGLHGSDGFVELPAEMNEIGTDTSLRWFAW
ncbi:MAG: molybdopterin molybdotransferase MoeA [Pseudomonadota bacterium]